MTETATHPKIVLCLPAGAYSLAPIEIAGEIARWIGAHLDTVASTEDTLDAQDVMPFAREFQPLLQRWKSWYAQEALSDRHLLQARFRREAEKIANASGVPNLFQTVSDELAARLGEISKETDIIAFPAPRHRGEELVGSYPEFLVAVSRLSRSLLVLPQAPVRRKGPILAVLSSDDLALRHLAEQMARAANEELIVMDADDGSDREALLRFPYPSGRRPLHFASRQEMYRSTLTGFHDLGERLVLISRRSCKDLTEANFLGIVATRGVPLFIAP